MSNKQEVEVEGGELALKNSNGDIVIIPKKDRSKVEKMITDECWGCVDAYVTKLPTLGDYAVEGGVESKVAQDANIGGGSPGYVANEGPEGETTPQYLIDRAEETARKGAEYDGVVFDTEKSEVEVEPEVEAEPEVNEEPETEREVEREVEPETEEAPTNVKEEKTASRYTLDIIRDQRGENQANMLEMHGIEVGGIETGNQNIYQTSGGPGTGVYQYETTANGGSGGTTTAIKRYKNFYKKYDSDIPAEYLKEINSLDKNDPDFTKLSVELQRDIFYADKERKNNFILDKLGTPEFSFKDAWLTSHWAGKEENKAAKSKQYDDYVAEVIAQKERAVEKENKIKEEEEKKK